jgi:hypothetical protein
MAETTTGKLEPMDYYAGSVTALWRYPVKSMQGEELNGAAITERGIICDRAYALRDLETGHIASAKHPGKWAKLFECRKFQDSSCLGDVPSSGRSLRLVFPAGTAGEVYRITGSVSVLLISCSRREHKPKASTGGWDIPETRGGTHPEVSTKFKIGHRGDLTIRAHLQHFSPCRV